MVDESGLRQTSQPLPPVTGGEIARLALPAAVSVLLNNAFRVVDQYSVQWLGPDAQAAMGAMTFVLIFSFAIYAVLAAGVGPLVARATGAGDDVLRAEVFGHGLVGSALLGVVVFGGLGIGARPLAEMLGLQGQVAEMAVQYLQALAWVGAPLAVGPVVDATFIAMGRTALPMALQVVATVLNLALNMWFIYGLDLGIAGAAYASGLSRLVAVLIGLAVLWHSLRLRSRHLGVGPATWRAGRVGLPISLNIAAYALVYWALLAAVISPLGPAVNAGLGIGFSALEGFMWPIFHGLSLAAASVVGRRLGAGQPEEAARAARMALPLSTGAGLIAGLVFFFGADRLCAIFTSEPDVLDQAVLYARVLAFSQVLVAWEALSEGVLEGAGDTRTVLWWSAPLNFLRVPLAWVLAIGLGFGPAGVWWAINTTTLLKVLGKGGAVLRGGWRDVKI